MGIINVTPDSFYDGGINNTTEKALRLAEKHLKEGATFLDIGGYSSRPGAKNITEKQELKRVLPVIEAIVKNFDHPILSVDTFRSIVAKEALKSGASMINDISAFSLDDKLIDVISQNNVPYILMHMQGNPQNMQQNPTYNNLIYELIYFFSNKIKHLKANGIHDIIIDPGFGFGKTLEDNFNLLNNLDKLAVLKLPILAGISRKSMIYKTLKTNSLNSLNGTTALHMSALRNGAKILRVHDVKQAQECIALHLYN
ncbi:MAG: dihydropteroate synthase [Flavobacteriales bacterium]|nr:dihydropteroate synthase [Flavobacteriales bacterium]MBG15322.1 dihydropteroate synthase [Crocinitomicaceae bacterium]